MDDSQKSAHNLADDVETEKDQEDASEKHQDKKAHRSHEGTTDSESMVKKAKEGKDNPEGPN